MQDQLNFFFELLCRLEKTFENINNEEYIEENTGSNAETSEKNMSHNMMSNLNKKEQCARQGIYRLHKNLVVFKSKYRSQNRNIPFE